MLKGQWGTAQRLATVAALAAVTLSGAGCTRLETGHVGQAQGWSGQASLSSSVFDTLAGDLHALQASPSPMATAAPVAAATSPSSFSLAKLSLSSLRDNLAKRYGSIVQSSVQSVDDLVEDDDATEKAVQAATSSVVFGFSGGPEQVQAKIATPGSTSEPSVTPAGPDDSASAASLLAAATSQWNWAHDQGFFQSKRLPHILESAVPSGAVGDSDGGLADAVGAVAKVKTLLSSQLYLVSDIRIARHAQGFSITDNDPNVDIQAVVLHEAWHVEAFESPDVNRFEGALLHNNAAGATFWKAATWSADQVTYKEVTARVPDLSQRLHGVGPNLSNIYEEASADTAAFTILAHAKSPDDWKHRLLRMDGLRARDGLYMVGMGDAHETQESLSILAHLGYDKLHALTPDQSRQLIDAVAADGALLAAAKQGWATNARTLADAADTLTTLDPKSFGEETGFMLEHRYAQMKPAAQAWAATPTADRDRIATGEIQKVQALWENGGQLDYSYIAPGLTVDLPAHGNAPSYEIDPVKTSSVPLSASEKRDVLSHRNAQALEDWKGMAQTMGYTSPAQIADLSNTEAFSSMVLWMTPDDQYTATTDKFWGANVGSLLTRVIARQEAQEQALRNASPTPDATVASTTSKSPKM